MRKCSICGERYTGFGHNAQPANDGRCCSCCNDTVVIPVQLARIGLRDRLEQVGAKLTTEKDK